MSQIDDEVLGRMRRDEEEAERRRAARATRRSRERAQVTLARRAQSGRRRGPEARPLAHN